MTITVVRAGRIFDGDRFHTGREVVVDGERIVELAERGSYGQDVEVADYGVTPGSLPHEAQFTVEELRALVEAAHGFGIPVAAHGHGVEGIESALIAGVDTIEHASFVTADSVADRPGLILRMVEAGVFAVGTAGSLPGGQLPPRLAAVLPLVLAHARRMHEAGVRIAVATDAGIAPSKPFNVQPYAVAEVAQLLGLIPALRRATSIAADATGLGGSIGRLRPGHTADLLVVDGNLEAGADALHHVKAVYRSGEPVGS